MEEESVEIINELSRRYKIIAITAVGTNPFIAKRRRNNLEKYFPDVFDEVHCTRYGAKKTHILSRYPSSIWIEDNVRNAKDGFDLGHTPILYANNYNKEDRFEGLHIANNWEEIHDIINNIDM